MDSRTFRASDRTSKPLTRTVPAVGDRSVATVLIVVVLPAPFGPRKPKNSPSGTVRSIPWTAAVPSA
jgi:hypothetical protein